MEAIHWLAAGLAAFIVGVVSAGACVFYFSRRIDDLNKRMSKIDQARQTAMQHGLQARTQVEMLQKEITELRRQRPQQAAPAHTVPPRREELDMMLAAGDRVAAAGVERPALTKSGFADTMPI